MAWNIGRETVCQCLAYKGVGGHILSA